MKIQKSGYYDITNNEELIEIEDNIHVTLFDEGENIKKIIVGKGVSLFFLWYSFLPSFDKHIFIGQEGSEVKVKILNFSKNINCNIQIFGDMQASYSSFSLDIYSLLAWEGRLDINAFAKIDKKREKSKISLLQKNIFLHDSASFSWVPRLCVESLDVEAHHACQIEKINKEKIFYLRSRGIPKRKAFCMIIEAYIENIFAHLKEKNSEKYEEIFREIMKHLDFNS